MGSNDVLPIYGGAFSEAENTVKKFKDASEYPQIVRDEMY
jgi:hypothetical protein